LAASDTFEEGVLLAVNLGEDADTTAAICGQLAGALYGARAIPKRWRSRLVMGKEIAAIAGELLELSDRLAPPFDSFWVRPSRLLAGPYPGDYKDGSAERKLNAFLDAGVTCFIDLTEPAEAHPYEPEVGELRPYDNVLRELARERGISAAYERMPIRDVSVPTRDEMREILTAIRTALRAGETVYVHCMGGVGRTGTVIGCLLVEDGVRPTEVVDELATLRRDTKRAHRISPETAQQRAFVRGWRASARDGFALA
jgi:hypothetical protein